MEPYEIRCQMHEIGEGIASVDFDSEFFTLRNTTYCALRLGGRYVVSMEIPEQDLDQWPLAYCINADAVVLFLEKQQAGFELMEGAALVVPHDLLPVLDEMSDHTDQVIELLDQAFKEDWDEDLDDDPVTPGEVLRCLVSGRGLRMSPRKDFVIDEDDRVFGRKGWVKFGPVWGWSGRFKSQLVPLLSCLGLSVECDDFVTKGKEKPEMESPQQFLEFYRRSRKFLTERRGNQRIQELEQKIGGLQRQENALRREIERIRRSMSEGDD